MCVCSVSDFAQCLVDRVKNIRLKIPFCSRSMGFLKFHTSKQIYEVFVLLFVLYDFAAIPSCSFPFTYNGGLYYSCITDMTGVSTVTEPFACLAVNATPVVCYSPGPGR